MSTETSSSDSWILPVKPGQRMRTLLPQYRENSKGGRPRIDLQAVANGIFYVLRTGIPWKAVPSNYGSGSTLHRYFQEWTAAGVFHKLWKAALLEHDELQGVQWDCQLLFPYTAIDDMDNGPSNGQFDSFTHLDLAVEFLKCLILERALFLTRNGRLRKSNIYWSLKRLHGTDPAPPIYAGA